MVGALMQGHGHGFVDSDLKSHFADPDLKTYLVLPQFEKSPRGLRRTGAQASSLAAQFSGPNQQPRRLRSSRDPVKLGHYP